jgi:hypothetical protein
MKLLSAIRHLLAVLAIAGLMIAPVAKPATAMHAAMQASAAIDESMHDHAGMAMSEDMPCCPKQVPHQAPIPDCAKDCVFMAMCATQLLANATQGAGLVVSLGRATVFLPGNEMNVAGLSQSPPPRPPKI